MIDEMLRKNPASEYKDDLSAALEYIYRTYLTQNTVR